MRRLLITAALLAISACSTPPLVAPPPVASPSPVVQPTPQPTVDQCGAAELQHLIGRSRLQAPVPVRPERQRVACTTCPMTQDYDPTRLNILFDAGTGRISEIRCG